MLDTNRIVKLACCSALALAFSGARLAAQQTSSYTPRKPGDLDEIRKVSTLIGMDVMNHRNTKIAILRDLLLAPDGAIMYAVLGRGGVAGVGESYTAIPFFLMGARHDDGKWAVNLDMTAEDLNAAPTIQSENYAELTDPRWIARVDQFVRARESVHHPDRRTGAAERAQQTVQHVLLATKIRGATLNNAQDHHLGKVEDLLLDRKHHVVFAIIGRGGVLGIGENYVPVPWSKLSLGADRQTAAVTVTIDASKAQLEKAPLVKAGSYVTLLAPGFAEQVRQYFGTTSHGAAQKEQR